MMADIIPPPVGPDIRRVTGGMCFTKRKNVRVCVVELFFPCQEVSRIAMETED